MLSDPEKGLIDENGKPSTKRIAEMIRLQNTNRFISKIYWTTVILFICAGALLAAAMFDDRYKGIVMAHQLLASIGVTAYIVIIILLLIFSSHDEMRIFTLMTIMFFCGALCGYVAALQLMEYTLNRKGQVPLSNPVR